MGIFDFRFCGRANLVVNKVKLVAFCDLDFCFLENAVLFFASRGASVDGTGVSGKEKRANSQNKTAPAPVVGVFTPH